MVAINFMKGTKYACNVDNKKGLIWMQYQFQMGLNMLVISNPKRTIYASNLFQYGTNMLAIMEILFDSGMIFVIASIFGPY